jgi:predicted O-methyltransferase YrrM
MVPSSIEFIQNRWKLMQIYYQRARALSFARLGRALMKPDSIILHLRRVLLGQMAGRYNFYLPSASRTEEVGFCRRVLGCEEGLAEEMFKEIEQDRSFVDWLSSRYRLVRPDSPIVFNLGRFKVWYAIVRISRPNLVLETGVHDGLSSSLILRAMSRNNCGCLVSLDLPDLNLPIGVDGPGWLVPDELKSRWRLRLGDSRRVLDDLAREHAPIDIFIHDSDHSPDFQTFEYQTVRPYLAQDGLLLGDDAIPELMTLLAKGWGASPILVAGAAPETGIMLAGMRLLNGSTHGTQRI